MKTREDLTGLTRAYWASRAVLTAVELGVFEALGKRRLGAAVLARRVGADPRALTLLLDALAGLGVLVKHRASWSVAPALRPFLAEGPESALGMLRHHARLWRAWSGLTDSVRTGRRVVVEHGSGFRRGPEAARAFTLAMRDGARRLAPGVAEEVPLRGCRRLLDLGGGPGTYAAAFARRYPGLRVTVVDLPDVVAVGKELTAAERDVRGRISWCAADLDTDPLPPGADAAFLSHVIHSQTEAQVRALFGKVAAALVPGGVLVVRDFFLEPDRVRPPSASLFALNMLVNTEGGRTYTAAEVVAWLKEAGFRSAVRRRSRAVPDTGYVIARTPR